MTRGNMGDGAQVQWKVPPSNANRTEKAPDTY